MRQRTIRINLSFVLPLKFVLFSVYVSRKKIDSYSKSIECGVIYLYGFFFDQREFFIIREIRKLQFIQPKAIGTDEKLRSCQFISFFFFFQ